MATTPNYSGSEEATFIILTQVRRWSMANEQPESPKVVYLREVAPHYFTERINAHRIAPLGGPKPVIGPNIRVVEGRVGRDKIHNFLLHLDSFTGEYKVSSHEHSWSEPVERDSIVTALNESVRTSWAHVRLKSRYVMLNRAQLLHNFNELEVKLKKKQKKA
jgi:hypothetical protein